MLHYHGACVEPGNPVLSEALPKRESYGRSLFDIP